MLYSIYAFEVAPKTSTSKGGHKKSTGPMTLTAMAMTTTTINTTSEKRHGTTETTTSASIPTSTANTEIAGSGFNSELRSSQSRDNNNIISRYPAELQHDAFDTGVLHTKNIKELRHQQTHLFLQEQITVRYTLPAILTWLQWLLLHHLMVEIKLQQQHRQMYNLERQTMCNKFVKYLMDLDMAYNDDGIFILNTSISKKCVPKKLIKVEAHDPAYHTVHRRKRPKQTVKVKSEGQYRL